MITFALYAISRILLLPIDIIVVLFGGMPLSRYINDKYVCYCNHDTFKHNDEYCQKKYGMHMLDKIRLEEKKVLGDDYDKIIKRGQALYLDPWYNLNGFYMMMCTTEGLFDDLLEEHINFLKNEKGQ